MTWQEEARGIEPWRGAVGFCVRGSERTVVWVWGDEDDRQVRYAELSGEGWPASEFTPNIENPDTCAAFDRRLALRLGAPEEVVREGVIIAVDEIVVPAERRPDGVEHRRHVLCVVAGLVKRADYIDDPLEWSDTVDVDTPDPLLARVRAWWSVKT